MSTEPIVIQRVRGKREKMHNALSESLLLRWGKTEAEEEGKPFADIQHIPLVYAYLCQDCDSVGNSAEQCPACASEVLMCLASVLNRGEVIEKNLVHNRVA